MPTIEGMEKFKGTMLHSHYFRTNDQFRNHNVVLLGANQSGQDIALILSRAAKNVYLSHKGRRVAHPLPDNVHNVSFFFLIQCKGYFFVPCLIFLLCFSACFYTYLTGTR